jgi:glucokinase
MMYIAGIDIGGTKCAVILGKCVDNNIIKVDIVDKISFKTQTCSGPNGVIDKLIQGLEGLLAKNFLIGSDIACIGISCGGPLNSEKGLILSPPNLIGWDNIPITAVFSKHFGVPAVLQNDANAGALAEWFWGAGLGCKNMVFCTFGTGFGSGIILNGKLYSGTNDMAGEIGHVRLQDFGPVGYGKMGSVEGFCSGGGIAQLAKDMALMEMQKGKAVSFCNGPEDLDNIDALRVAQAADKGDLLAAKVYEISGIMLGKALAILIDILNPEVIVIGSIFKKSQDLIWPYTKKVINEECLSYSRNICEVLPSALGDAIGDYEALAIAADHIANI